MKLSKYLYKIKWSSYRRQAFWFRNEGRIVSCFCSKASFSVSVIT